MANTPPVHWADQTALRVINQKGDKEQYTLAAGITPSGTIHIGNFREVMTVDLIARALKSAGKKVRFIYSWDDYDVFRKVPKGFPKQDYLQTQLRKPIVDVEDPFGTDESYAAHNEKEMETDVAKVGIVPEYLYQAKKYRNLEYVQGIITALKNTEAIKSYIDAHRTEPLGDDWLPLTGFCPTCRFDEIIFSEFDGEENIRLNCQRCEFNEIVNIKTCPDLKLPWRVDWPMRWAHEQVDFEPGGKDHSTAGGSYDTGKQIVELYDWTAPIYLMYNFIGIKGGAGKISSSAGNVITLATCLDIYEPAIVRYLFAGTRPGAEFNISFDLDVNKIYEDFDKCERIYFDKEIINEKKAAKEKRIYELSCPFAIPKEMPFQPSFRHLTNMLQTFSYDMDQVVTYYQDELKTEADKDRLLLRAKCATNWLKNYAPEEFIFEVNSAVPESVDLSQQQVQAIHAFADSLLTNSLDEKELHNSLYEIARANDCEPKDLFAACYAVLISKEKGPQLASFILTYGKEKVAALFKAV
jgi:lysyl-tRNA synthetase class 1